MSRAAIEYLPENLRAIDPIELGGWSAEKGESKVRLIKMFGLAALAAVAAMAFVGATSAMAGSTQLCEADNVGCTAASHVHFTTLAGTKAELLSSLVNIKCDVLNLGLTLGLGAPLVIHGNFTYTNCETGSGSGCTVTELSSSALLEILKNGTETAEVTFQYEVLMECGSFIHCVYNGTNLNASVEGSLLTGHATISKQTVNKVSGFLCPKTTTLDILLGSLTSLYINT